MMGLVSTLILAVTLTATPPVERPDIPTTQELSAKESSRFLITGHGGVFQPRAQGSVFDVATSNLTLSRSDFRMERMGLNAAVRVRPRVYLLLGGEAGDTEATSFVRGAGAEEMALRQTTTLKMNTAYYGGIAADLLHSTSGSWLVQGLAGVGRSGYRFEQVGSFPDGAPSGGSFSDTLRTRGTGTTTFLGIRGIRTLNGPLALTVDLRGQRGEADVGGDYLDFSPISLSGIGLMVGVALRF